MADWVDRAGKDADGEDAEEGEEEDLDDARYMAVKDAVLFLIDVSSSMLQRPPESDSTSKKGSNDSATLAALKCAYQLMQQRIISNPNDKLGILLYGTEQSKFPNEDAAQDQSTPYPHCYLLTDLDIPAAEDVKALKAIVEDEDESSKLLVPSPEPVSMANVLFCANTIFATRAANFSSRRLFVVTDNDDPHAKDPALKSTAIVRGKDLYDLGVVIELFPIAQPDQGFDRSKFYDNMIYRNVSTESENLASPPAPLASSSAGNGISLLNSLLSSVKSKAVARRALFSNMPLEIGPGFSISVKGFIIYKRQTPARSCYVWLNGEKAQIAKGTSIPTADDTARPVEPAEIKKAYKFGGGHVAFTTDEAKSLRYFGEPVIRIIGFKPVSLLPFWASVKPSTFIYPSEDDYVGSTRVFSALQQKLLKDDKMGLAWFIPRRNAVPTIVAILPSSEKIGEEGNQISPPGLWLVPLPYADDVRQDPDTTHVVAPDSLVDMMRKVIQQLQLPKAQYNPGKYPNPALQWHYRILQAMALDEDLPEKPEDATIPKYRQIDKRAGDYVIEWGKELEEQYRVWQREHHGSSVPSKRAAAQTTDGNLPKRPKTGATTAGVSNHSSSAVGSNHPADEDMKMHYEKGTLNKLTVSTLKAWMEGKKISVAGKKADLVDAIEAWFDTKPVVR
ncbi:MAG: ATP-dependent DNA helicase II subunit 1 [Sarcosagium campestre]|nr:MAG: ATP-dependent DNA helicase II subunit 1 [Sarcosagium campestre]